MNNELEKSMEEFYKLFESPKDINVIYNELIKTCSKDILLLPPDKGMQTLRMKAGLIKPSRNKKCPCGSGKKYKKCCERWMPQ